MANNSRLRCVLISNLIIFRDLIFRSSQFFDKCSIDVCYSSIRSRCYGFNLASSAHVCPHIFVNASLNISFQMKILNNLTIARISDDFTPGEISLRSNVSILIEYSIDIRDNFIRLRCRDSTSRTLYTCTGRTFYKRLTEPLVSNQNSNTHTTARACEFREYCARELEEKGEIRIDVDGWFRINHSFSLILASRTSTVVNRS